MPTCTYKCPWGVSRPICIFHRQQLHFQDNVPPHIAREFLKYLEEFGIQKMNWPARSPDFNLIEHLWNELQSCIRRRENSENGTRYHTKWLQLSSRACQTDWMLPKALTVWVCGHAGPKEGSGDNSWKYTVHGGSKPQKVLHQRYNWSNTGYGTFLSHVHYKNFAFQATWTNFYNEMY